MKKTLIIYHRVDYDGLFSCALAERFYRQKGIEVDFFGYNYGDTVPDIDAFLRKYAAITLVDISFYPEIMMKLCESSRATWIDHHITAIQDSQTYGYDKLAGIRESGNKAACELVWNYFWPDAEVPEIIQLISSYDVWDHDRFPWHEKTLPLQYGLKSSFGINLKQILEHFDEIMECPMEFLEEGQVIYNYLRDLWKSWVKNYSFDITVAGKYRGICIISPVFGSSCFESVTGTDYDIYVVVEKKRTDDGSEVYSIGMYAEDSLDPNFSCGEYMKQFNGGGHRSAAGGTLTREQFISLVFENKI